MRIRDYNQMMAWLVRPKDNFTRREKKETLQKFYNQKPKQLTEVEAWKKEENK